MEYNLPNRFTNQVRKTGNIIKENKKQNFIISYFKPEWYYNQLNFNAYYLIFAN